MQFTTTNKQNIMKGWVYVITNSLMPGVVKIGFSRKEASLRADELRSTGSPGKYEVEYEVLVEEPFEIEQQVHAVFSAVRVDLEWFKLDVGVAISGIKKVAEKSILYEAEKYKITDISPDGSKNKNRTKKQRLSTTDTFKDVCPSCGKTFTVSLRRSEDSVTCPHCHRSFKIKNLKIIRKSTRSRSAQQSKRASPTRKKS